MLQDASTGQGEVCPIAAISEQHLQRYVDKFAFRWNTRSSLGIEDTEQAALAIKGAAGKRLTYRCPNRIETKDNQTTI